MQYSAVQCSAVQFSAVQYSAVLYSTMQYGGVCYVYSVLLTVCTVNCTAYIVQFTVYSIQ